MRAEIEPLAGLIRVGVGEFTYSRPYRWSATVRYLSPEEVEIVGVNRTVTPEIWKAVMDCMAENNIKLIVAKVNGETHRIAVPSDYRDLWVKK